jgi:hypothetical protein
LRVSWSHSLAAKLFLLISTCLLFTMIGSSRQSVSVFSDFFTRQFEDQTVQQAKDTTNNVEAIFETVATDFIRRNIRCKALCFGQSKSDFPSLLTTRVE